MPGSIHVHAEGNYSFLRIESLGVVSGGQRFLVLGGYAP